MNPKPKLLSEIKTEEYRWIAEAAYYKSLARSFATGHDQEDWLEARKDFEQKILSKQHRNGLVSLVSDRISV